MTAKDVLKNGMDVGLYCLLQYLSDLSDSDLLIRPGGKANHLAWQLGHLISSENQLVSAACPGSMPALPPGFLERHARDMVGVDDPAKFQTKQEYVDLYQQQRQAAKAALDKLPDADLDKPGPEKMRKYCPTIGALFHLLGSHPMMHAGQFVVVRRTLGKPILI